MGSIFICLAFYLDLSYFGNKYKLIHNSVIFMH